MRAGLRGALRSPTVAPVQLERGPLLADDTLTGTEWCARHSALIDAWLASLFERAIGAAGGDAQGAALVAVGGYGRSELCPQSDLDVMLLHGGRRDIATVAEHVWYPIWDEGLKLGHSVCTTREALTLADGDMDTATALLSAGTSPATSRSRTISRAAPGGSGNRDRSAGCRSSRTASSCATRKRAKSRSCSNPI